MDTYLVENLADLQFNDTFFLGVQWEPNEFIEQVLKAKHPCELGNTLPNVVCRTVENMYAMDDVAMTKKRLTYLKYWRKRANLCETSFKIETWKLKNEAFVRNFFQK